MYIIALVFISTAVALDYIKKLHPVLYYISNALILGCIMNTRTVINGAEGALNDRAAESVLMNCDTAGNNAVGNDKYAMALSRCLLETVAAPLFYFSIGAFLGVATPLAAAYKASAALARAIGGNGFWPAPATGGRRSAPVRIASFLNYVPARLCGVILPMVAPLCGEGARGARRGLKATKYPLSPAPGPDGSADIGEAVPAAAIYAILGRKPEEGYDAGRAAALLRAASVAAAALFCAALAIYVIIFQTAAK